MEATARHPTHPEPHDDQTDHVRPNPFVRSLPVFGSAHRRDRGRVKPATGRMTPRLVVQGRWIRNLARHLGFLAAGDVVTLGLLVTDDRRALVQKAGFTEFAHGVTLLPQPRGRVSVFNAVGRHVVHRDQPKETAYRTVRWRWVERHGKDKVEREDWKDVPYQRYPRTFVPPPSVELSLVQDEGSALTVTAPPLAYDPHSAELLHQVNLFLDLFREVHVLGDAYRRLPTGDERRVNWRFLPPSEHPWTTLRAEIEPVFERARGQKRAFLEERLETIAGYVPDYTVVGAGGFTGYVMFAFPARNLFVLESALYGNATYILRGEWEQLAAMTKAELLHDGLHEARLVHQAAWAKQLQAYLA